MQQAFLDSEKEVLDKLKKNYQDALNEINSKIELLMARQDADMSHVIYQVEYQKALKKQVQGILDTLQANEFETVSEYLAKSYEDGFIGTMYDIQGQGMPIVMPMDQEQIVQAIQHETKLKESLYEAFDIKDLQKKISSEISRGISTGMMFPEIARNISNYAGISRNKAMRIARTEGHRIQCKATMDAQHKAKEKGADVVKQWDSTLDKRTRKSHRRVDGEVRELDEPFSNGLMFPGDPDGGASEVVNCRCALLQRARWALDEEELETLKKRAEYFELDKAENFADYKKKYLKAVEEERVRLSPQKIKPNYAKASDVFLYGDDLPEDIEVTPDALLKHMETSEVGREAIEYIESSGIKPQLIYEPQRFSHRGEQSGDTIKIYMANIISDRVGAQTVIHEITHHKYGIGGCQWAEAVCMAKEKMHKEGRNYLTGEEIRYIVDLAKRAYPEYEWKKGGYKNGKYF